MLTVTYAECHIKAPYAESHYAECHYAERRYAECCGALMTALLTSVRLGRKTCFGTDTLAYFSERQRGIKKRFRRLTVLVAFLKELCGGIYCSSPKHK